MAEVNSKVLVEVINGFIRSLLNSLNTMAFTEAHRVDIYLKKPNQAMKGDVSAIITLFGELSGTCAISFPRKLAVKLIQKMMMDDSIDDINEEVQDGIGEIANLIGGGAKADLATLLGTKASLSIPTVITGINHRVEHQNGVPCIGCVFEAEGERMFLEVACYPEGN
jgi:chemotaxis protein CheX